MRLIIHGDDDQVVPCGAAGQSSAKIIPGAEPKAYEGAPHGLINTRVHRVNEDFLASLKQ